MLSTDEADADMTTGRIYFGASANQTYHYDDYTFHVPESTQLTMDEDQAITAVYVWKYG